MTTQMLTTTTTQTDWLPAFEASLTLLGRSERTIKAYRLDVCSFASWSETMYGQAFDLACFNRSDLQAFAKEQKKVMKPATWNRRLASLRVFAAFLRRNGQIDYDPTDVLEQMDEVELAPRWLTEMEYRLIMRHLEACVVSPRPDTPSQKRQALRDRAMVGLMALAGLREDEVVQLHLQDLEIGERKGRVTIRSGKGNKRRQVPFGRELVIHLVEWLAVRGELEHGHVFVGKQGPIGADGIQRRVAELAIGAGVKEVTPHRFRHTYVKRLLDAGVPIQMVAKLAGHNRLETTARYGMPSMVDLEAAVEVL